MKTHAFALGLGTAALVALGGCTKESKAPNGAPKAQTEKAQKVAGTKTIAAGLPANSPFMAAAKTAGLDQALSGPGPYTVGVRLVARVNPGAVTTLESPPLAR